MQRLFPPVSSREVRAPPGSRSGRNGEASRKKDRRLQDTAIFAVCNNDDVAKLILPTDDETANFQRSKRDELGRSFLRWTPREMTSRATALVWLLIDDQGLLSAIAIEESTSVLTKPSAPKPLDAEKMGRGRVVSRQSKK